MKSAGRVGIRTMLHAFLIWFAHFMLCWTAVEIWPDALRANMLAWGFTAVALLAMGMQWVQVHRSTERGELATFDHQMARGSIAIAALAILFTTLPSIVFLPRVAA